MLIPVTLTVSAQPQLLVSPPTLSFSYQLLSGSSPPQQTVSISTADQATAPVSAMVSTVVRRQLADDQRRDLHARSDAGERGSNRVGCGKLFGNSDADKSRDMRPRR